MFSKGVIKKSTISDASPVVLVRKADGSLHLCVDNRILNTEGLLVRPQRTYSFTPQLPEQLSSAIKPGPATLVNSIQCPLREKVILHPMVSSKTSTGSIRDGSFDSTRTHQIPTACFQTPQLLFHP